MSWPIDFAIKIIKNITLQSGIMLFLRTSVAEVIAHQRRVPGSSFFV